MATRKRKSSSFLNDDEKFYIHPPRSSSRKTREVSSNLASTSKSEESKKCIESFKQENESLAVLQSQLIHSNRELLEENFILKQKFSRKFKPEEEISIEGVDWTKYPTGILSVSDLARLWSDICEIPFPTCSCPNNKKINRVAKKRITQIL